MSASCPRMLPTWWVGTTLLVVAFVVVFDTPTPGGGGKPKADPQEKSYLKQLHKRFEEWDKNGDKVLDKTELAKAFRGPTARAYDDQPPPKTLVTPPAVLPEPTEGKTKVKSTSVMLASLPTAGLPVNLVLAELLARPSPPTTPANTAGTSATVITAPPANVNTFADVQFLQLLQKVDAGKISKQEFDTWAKDYAKLLDRLVDGERNLRIIQQNGQKAKTKQDVQATQKALQAQEKELQPIRAQLDKIPSAIQQAFRLKR